MNVRRIVALLISVSSCGGSTRPHAQSIAPRVVDAAIAAQPEHDAAAAPSVVTRTGTEWPYHAYDRAEALTFNQYSETNAPRDFGLYAYSDRGWNHHLSARKSITAAQASKARALLKITGQFELTKCTFPRHAVVLYEGDTPIASINVCFECGGILTWPEEHVEPPKVEPPFEEQLKQWHVAVALFTRTLPKWKSFFQDDVGLSVDNQVWLDGGAP
jgi:hypothetical protein